MMDFRYHQTQAQHQEDVEMGNANSAMLENIVQTSNCTFGSPYSIDALEGSAT